MQRLIEQEKAKLAGDSGHLINQVNEQLGGGGTKKSPTAEKEEIPTTLDGFFITNSGT